MNTEQKGQLITWIIVACAPVAGVFALRTMSGVGGPQPAAGAIVDTSSAGSTSQQSSGGGAIRVPDRLWIVSKTEAARLDTVVSEQVKAWTTPLFPSQAPIVSAELPEDDSPREAPIAAPMPPSAARFAELFKVSSLMTTRNGPVAVIDRKLRRVGDELREGVVVEAIDLDARVVVLRTAEGAIFERRTSR